MTQRIKPDRPIWPPLPDADARTAPVPGPAQAPRHGGSGRGVAGPQAQRIATATVEAFGSFAG